MRTDDVASTVNSSVKMGTIIKYDEDDTHPKYGVVMPPPSFAKLQGVYVHNISASEASDIKKRNKNQTEVEVGSSSVKPIKNVMKNANRKNNAEKLYKFIFGDGTINFADGVSAIEFFLILLLFFVFFTSMGFLWMMFSE